MEQAVGVAARALAVNATPDTKNLLARYVGALLDADQAEPYRDLVGQAFRDGWTRPSDLERVGMLLIRRNPAVSSALTRAAATVQACSPRASSRRSPTIACCTS